MKRFLSLTFIMTLLAIVTLPSDSGAQVSYGYHCCDSTGPRCILVTPFPLNSRCVCAGISGYGLVCS